MLFLGDFVFPYKDEVEFYSFNKEFIDEPKMINLESLILDPSQYPTNTTGIALHSSNQTFSILKDLNVRSVGLANNHITDYAYNIEDLQAELTKHGIQSSGAGKNMEESIKPSLVEDEQYKYAIFSFGWNVIGCQYANKNQQGIAALDEKLILHTVKDAKMKYPDYKIILFLHWNYEFEYYPQPADRRLAFAAINAGVDMIVGHHPHIVGVYELYNNKPIFYSLGNFFIPEYTFGGFDLVYNELAKTGVGVKYSDTVDNILLYWMKNDDQHLSIDRVESLAKNTKLEDFSDHYQDDLKMYAQWFSKHRKKKKLLPIYKKHTSSLTNNFMFTLLKMRNYVVHKLTACGLRKRNS